MTSKDLSRPFVLAIAAIGAMLLLTLCILPQAAQAGVGPGGSSTGGGSACPGGPRGGVVGCPYTSNGQGWYEIPVDSPNAPRGNGYWSTANSTCRGEGATHVMAYVVLTGSQTLATGWIYQFTWGWETYGPYTGNVSVPTAQARFNALPASERAGYTFGSNLGWYCYNSNPPWSIRAESYIRKAPSTAFGQTNLSNVRPGETIQFAHDLRAQGRINERIYYTIRGTGFPNAFRGTSQPTVLMQGSVAPAINNNALFVNFNANGSPGNPSYMTYTVVQNDVGNTLCQRIEYAPTTNTNGGASATPFRCANVPYSYALTPQIIDMTDNEVVENAIGPIEVSGRVTNSGATKSHTNIEWQLTQVLYAPGDAIPQRAGGVDLRDPCTYLTGEIAGSCGATASGSGVEASGYARNETKTYDGTGNLGDRPVGTRVCFLMSVKRNSSSNTDWRHSRMYCRVVGKEPKVQVLGGDLIVGRDSASNAGRQSNVDTSVTQPLSGRYFGSWAEYAIVASGHVYGMASGSGYVGSDGAGSTTNVMCSLSFLTFTNGGNPTCNVNNIGLYEHTKASPNIAGRFPISTTTARITTPDVTLSDMQGLYTTSRTTLNVSGGADIGITSNPAKVGQEVIINAPNTTVTITDNINYTDDTLRNIREIPQVVIIARNIIIQDDVQNIDSWLVAVGSGNEGRINTCGGSNSGSITEATLPHAGQCNLKLTVNGPVSANHLFLKRTAGSGTGAAAGEPAEVLNLRADSYIWASGYSPGTGRLPTVTTTELPPRF